MNALNLGLYLQNTHRDHEIIPYSPKIKNSYLCELTILQS